MRRKQYTRNSRQTWPGVQLNEGLEAVKRAAVGLLLRMLRMIHLHPTRMLFVLTVTCLVLLAPGSALGGDRTAETLRVMTFNIRNGRVDDGLNSWPQRRELLAAVIRDFSPDILATQEAQPFQIEFLKKSLPTHAYVGRSRELDNKKGEQCAIFFRRERFALRREETFWLSKTPDAAGSIGWDAALPRIVTWVELQDQNASDRLIRLFNTHFDHRGEKARLESARLLKRRIIALDPLPTLLLGDFNAADDSEVHGVLVGSGPREKGLRFTNAYRLMHTHRAEAEATFHGYKGPRVGKPVDWILFSGGLWCDKAWIGMNREGHRFPSDHFPVSAVLRYANH